LRFSLLGASGDIFGRGRFLVPQVDSVIFSVEDTLAVVHGLVIDLHEGRDQEEGRHSVDDQGLDHRAAFGHNRLVVLGSVFLLLSASHERDHISRALVEDKLVRAKGILVWLAKLVEHFVDFLPLLRCVFLVFLRLTLTILY